MKILRTLGSLALSTSLVAASSGAMAAEPDQVTAAALTGHIGHAGDPPKLKVNREGAKGFDSIVNFTGQFTFPGFDNDGKPQSVWPWTMIGRSPRKSETTIIRAPLIPVSLDLRNADGTPRFVNGQRLYYDATQYVWPVLNSPIFRPAKFSTSDFPTQYIDAIMRATFWHGAGDGDFDRGDHVSEFWHTFLLPLVRTPRVMTLTTGQYQFSLNADGTCCQFVLVDANAFGNALFPATATDTTTPIGAAEHAKEMTTKDMTTFLFPNTFLYNNGDPNQCCTVGYHTYDWEPGDAKNGNLDRRYVLDFASWVTPGLFGPTFSDVTPLSHELDEAFNDPFVDNATPWWNSNGLCQNNLETGDVIETLANTTFPMTVDGYVYHPQNEALLQWFAGATPSTAWHHAYSYPDTTVLTAPAASLNPLCVPTVAATAAR